MQIAIAAEHANATQLTGVEHYTRELIYGLARIDTRNRYLLYFRTPPGAWTQALPPSFKVRYLPSPFLWTQLRLSLAMLQDRPNALLIPSFAMPILHPRNSVVTIHDMAWLLFPETETFWQRFSLRITHWVAGKFARHLIAVSNTTQQDIVHKLGVQESRIRVVHHGFHPAPEPADQSVSQKKVSQPYIVCLGTLQPRKNLIRLIKAFSLLRRRSPLAHTLVIAGRAGWMCQDVLDMIAATPNVMYLGYVKDRMALLRDADLLVQPSLYEGFGLSVLDAFSEGVPVACSNVSSLPEIAQDAGELFDPYNVESIAAAMMNVLGNPVRAQQLRQQGRRRLQDFSWDRCAAETLAVLEEGA